MLPKRRVALEVQRMYDQLQLRSRVGRPPAVGVRQSPRVGI